jgi:hypothetical protein
MEDGRYQRTIRSGDNGADCGDVVGGDVYAFMLYTASV